MIGSALVGIFIACRPRHHRPLSLAFIVDPSGRKAVRMDRHGEYYDARTSEPARLEWSNGLPVTHVARRVSARDPRRAPLTN